MHAYYSHNVPIISHNIPWQHLIFDPLLLLHVFPMPFYIHSIKVLCMHAVPELCFTKTPILTGIGEENI